MHVSPLQLSALHEAIASLWDLSLSTIAVEEATLGLLLTGVYAYGSPDLQQSLLHDAHCVTQAVLDGRRGDAESVRNRLLTRLEDTLGEISKQPAVPDTPFPTTNSRFELAEVLGEKNVPLGGFFSALQKSLKHKGLSLQHVEITVDRPDTTSYRMPYRICIISKETGELVVSYCIKDANKPMEFQRAEFATHIGLGPALLYGDERVVIEDFVDAGWDLRHMGVSLTREETKLFGRNLAIRLHQMVSGGFVLYHSNIPATHILFTQFGPNLDFLFLDWSNSTDLEEIGKAALASAVQCFIREAIYLFRIELSSAEAAAAAWRSFVSVFGDAALIPESETRKFYAGIVSGVEQNLGEINALWKSFFEYCRLVHVPTQFEQNHLLRTYFGVPKTPATGLTETAYPLKLEQAGIHGEECARAIANDIVRNGKLEEILGVDERTARRLLEEFFYRLGWGHRTVSNLIASISAAVLETGSSLFLSSVLESFLPKIFQQNALFMGGDKMDNPAQVAREAISLLHAAELNRLDFKKRTGVVGMNRPWADHLLVLGPEPDRKTLLRYNIKESHSRPSVATEVRRSRLASEIGLGPRFVYGEEETGLIVELWLDDGTLAKRAPQLTEEEKRVVARRLAKKLHRMFDTRRGVFPITHKFDNLAHHVFVVGNGPEEIDPLFIDWGKDYHVQPQERQYAFTQHLLCLGDLVRVHLGVPGMVVFIQSLMLVASRTSREELEFVQQVLEQARRAMARHLYFGARNREFFAQVDAATEQQKNRLD